MNRIAVPCLLIIACQTCLASAPGTAGQKPTKMDIGSFTVEGPVWKGPITGPWEWDDPVTVRGFGMVMTCKHLKAWPPQKGKEFERVEASGDIRIEGQRRDSNGNLWDLKGTADRLVYDKDSASLALEGPVSIAAVNLTTGSDLSVDAKKLTIDLKNKTFRGEDAVLKSNPAEEEAQTGGPPSQEPAEGGTS
jgi:hypothetical protein